VEDYNLAVVVVFDEYYEFRFFSKLIFRVDWKVLSINLFFNIYFPLKNKEKYFHKIYFSQIKRNLNIKKIYVSNIYFTLINKM
jgi:hypothetical protein